jgi:hypothetical protein
LSEWPRGSGIIYESAALPAELGWLALRFNALLETPPDPRV